MRKKAERGSDVTAGIVDVSVTGKIGREGTPGNVREMGDRHLGKGSRGIGDGLAEFGRMWGWGIGDWELCGYGLGSGGDMDGERMGPGTIRFCALGAVNFAGGASIRALECLLVQCMVSALIEKIVGTLWHFLYK
jgi:hypothetical protein